MKFWTLFLTTLLILGCETPEVETDDKQVINEKSLISFASHFDLIQSDDNFLLHLMSPESGEIEQRYFLTKEQKGSKKGYITIKIPSTKLITLSGTSIGMLATLNEQDRIVGVSSKNYIYDERTLNRIKTNLVIEIGNESNLPLEKIIKAKPQLILYNGFGSEFSGSKKLNAVNIKSLPIYDWRETHPLGKAEWIKLFGVLSNKYDEANTYFKEIELAYFNLKEKAKSFSEKPTVLSGNILGDIWYAPNGDSFVSQMLEDANIDYVYQNTHGTGSLELSLEQIIKDNINTNFWINPGFSSQAAILELNPKLKFVGPLENSTYCYSRNMNLFWERSAIEPHHVLSDFIQIFHPESSTSDSLYFYKKVN